MIKYFNYLLFTFLISTTVFILGAFTAVTSVSAQTMNISQFVELLITIGAIAPDKAVAARAVAVTLSQTGSATTTTVTATSSLPYFQVLTPNGGESWDIDLDLPYTITWGSSAQLPVNISLIGGKTTVCNLTSIPVTTRAGDNSFSILLKTAKCYNQATGSSTSLADGSYKVRVSYTTPAGVTVKDESNSTFKILPVPIPSIKVTYPNGTESLIRHHEYAIKYSLSNVTVDSSGLIYFYLLDSNGNNAYNSHKLAKNGAFDLELPSSLSAGAYKLKLKLTTNKHVEIEDTSDNFFWVSTGL